jgi:hypothetical protein
MADDIQAQRQKNLQEAVRLLATLDLAGSHHLEQCAHARVGLLATFRYSRWRHLWDAFRAKFRAKFELFRSLRRDNAALRAQNEKLRLQLLAGRHHR